MKTFLRVSAVLSFLFCALGGLWVLSVVALSKGPYGDTFLVASIGLFLVGMAFFFGGILLFAAEKVGRQATKETPPP
jgi:hypothetical protein